MPEATNKIKILNPFTQNPRELYRCFGCSPYNETGLQLQFYLEDDAVCADWMPAKKFEGYVDVLHGGIQSTLMDEIASWYIYAVIGTSGVTKLLNIEYHHPVRINGTAIHLRASLNEQKDNEVIINTELYSNNKLCASGKVTYFIFPERIARAKYNYPGKEAFFEESY